MWPRHARPLIVSGLPGRAWHGMSWMAAAEGIGMGQETSDRGRARRYPPRGAGMQAHPWGPLPVPHIAIFLLLNLLLILAKARL